MRFSMSMCGYFTQYHSISLSVSLWVHIIYAYSDLHSRGPFCLALFCEIQNAPVEGILLYVGLIDLFIIIHVQNEKCASFRIDSLSY